MEYDSAQISRIFGQCIMPRPIAWVTTVNREGLENVAPFSLYTAVSMNPPLIGVTILARQGGKKADTLANILNTHEFVVSVVTEENAEKMNMTAINFPPDISEVPYAKLKTIPASVVRPPLLSDSPINLECTLYEYRTYGGPSTTYFVVGEVVRVHINDSVLTNSKINYQAIKTIGRLSGNSYCRTVDTFDMARPYYKEK